MLKILTQSIGLMAVAGPTVTRPKIYTYYHLLLSEIEVLILQDTIWLTYEC